GSSDSDIQQAIDAVPDGHVINIEAGTYIQQIVIDAKELTLLGQGNSTIIQSPESLSTDAGYLFIHSGSTKQSVITVRSDADATISNLLVDGDGRGNAVVSGNDFVGIGVHNADANINGVTVTGIRDGTLSGMQRGRAIFVGNSSGEHAVSITGSTIS